MALRPQTFREWAVIVIGSILVVVVLGYLYIVDPGMKKIEKDKKNIRNLEKALIDANELKQKRLELELKYRTLVNQYSNHLDTISDIKIPLNLNDLLTKEFFTIDQLYGSNIKRTRIGDPKTNDMFSVFSYGLSQVDCDWKSLNMLLFLVENAGQLVGFDNITIKGDEKVPQIVRANISQMNVQSYVFQDKGSKPWQMPDYVSATEELPRNIFQIPEAVQKKPPDNRQGPDTPIGPKDQLPPWARHIQLTGLISFGSPHAIFMDKAKRKSFRTDIGGVISNAQPESTLTSIDFMNETVTVAAGPNTYTLPLRIYRESMTMEDTSFSFGKGTPVSSVPGSVGTMTEGDTNAPPVVAQEETVVPKTYEKELGSYAECSVKLGVFLIKVDKYVQRRNRLDTDYGLMIYRTQKLSPGEKGGLTGRDVIVEIDGKKITDTANFTYAMNEAYRNNKYAIPVTVKRKNELKQITINME